MQEGTCKYLNDTKRRYALDGESFTKTEGGLEALLEVVKEWVSKPYMLFRNYSIESMDKQLLAKGMQLN